MQDVVPKQVPARRSQGRACRPGSTASEQWGPGVPQDIVRRLDFTFYTDPVDSLLKAFGILRRDLPRGV